MNAQQAIPYVLAGLLALTCLYAWIRTIGKAASITTQVVRTLFTSVLIGLVVVLLMPSKTEGEWVTLVLIAMGFLAIGTAVGFLFGLPKSIESTQSNASQPTTAPETAATTAPGASMPFVRVLQTSNNLQKVSDWLTTAITGITLSQLVKVPAYVERFGAFLQDHLGVGSYMAAAGAGLSLYFPVAGFTMGYLITRLVLTGEFDRADRELVEGDQQQVQSATSGDFKLFADSGAAPTVEQIQAAVRISQIPLSSLTTGQQKAAWARAQAILKNWSNAVLAYQQAIVLLPNDVSLLEDYANALYETKTSVDDVVTVLDRAETLSTDSYELARIKANKTLAYLDAKDFEKALDVINGLLENTTLPKRARHYFYRARANGLKWASVAQRDPNDPSLGLLRDAIMQDARQALNLDPGLAQWFRSASVSDINTVGNLASFAASIPEYRALIGLNGDND